MSFDPHSTLSLLFYALSSSISPALSGSCATSFQPRICPNPHGLGGDGFTESDPPTFCSSRLTFFSKCEFRMILFKAEAIFASNISKFGRFLSATDRDDFKSSIESTISTSWIHNMASEGNSEEVVTWFRNLVFQHKSDDGAGICQIEVPISAVFAVQPQNSVAYSQVSWSL